jgi:pyruvate/2-oxoglutarate dehydrogenase complex dihydrolipoamide acyltransferase (E2) component
LVELTLPDIDLPGVPIIVSAWHAKAGQRVIEGDRLIEISAGDVTVDLSAPATGVLAEQCVRIDDRITVGQRLARIEPT